MTRLLSLLALVATVAVAVPAPVANLAGSVDPAIAEGLAVNPRLKASMDHAAVKRDTNNEDADPAIAAYYDDKPALAQFMNLRRGEPDAEGKLAGRAAAPPSVCASNGTDMFDIRQTTLNDCWLASTMLTMSYVNAWWPISRFDVARDALDVSAAVVRLTPPGGEFNHTVELATLFSEGVAFSAADEHWWPAAIEASVLAYGQATGRPQILLDGGKASDGLQLLTGYVAEATPNDAPMDEVFSRMQNPEKSPILLVTLATGTTTLQAWHVYAVLGSLTDSNGDRRVLLRNPLGFGQWYLLDDVYSDIANVIYLPNGENGPPA